MHLYRNHFLSDIDLTGHHVFESLPSKILVFCLDKKDVRDFLIYNLNEKGQPGKKGGIYTLWIFSLIEKETLHMPFKYVLIDSERQL